MGNRRCMLLVLVVACTTPVETQVTRQAITQCGSNLPEGIDVYSGDGTIDWTKVASSGRTFAFIKATQGDYNKQSNFAANWSGALAAGVLRSPYHFFDGTIDGVAQANAFLAEVTGAGGLAVGDLPPMLDIECPTSGVEADASSGCEYAGDSGWVAPATLKQRVFDWIDTVQTATGMTPILYSYVSWFGDVSLTDPRLASYPLFISSLNACATIPAPWTAATFWQYSVNTSVPGIAQPGDVDRFFGSAAGLEGLTLQPPATPVALLPLPGGDAGTAGPDSPDGGGCASSKAPSPWWLVGFAALVVGIRSRRRPRRRRR
jgi:lysozyme